MNASMAVYTGSSLSDLTLAAEPVANILAYTEDPSIFDTIQFVDGSTDPAGIGIQSQAWSFAVLVDHRDALPADNEFVSLPVTVRRR